MATPPPPLFPKGEEKKWRMRLCEWLVLYKMNFYSQTFSIMLDLENRPLQPVFQNLLRDKLVDIKGTSFILTEKAFKESEKFDEYYKNYLKNLDIYCAVDLVQGKFAFEDSERFGEDEKAWQAYLKEDRFEDLRIAVINRLEINPSLILFLSFMKEGRFTNQMKEHGWQYDLLIGSFWEDMQNVYNNSLKIEDLAYKDEEGHAISGEDVIDDVIEQGQQVCLKLDKTHVKITYSLFDYKGYWKELV